MTQYIMGIDCGSAFCKGVLLSTQDIHAFVCVPTGWDFPERGKQIIREFTKQTRVSFEDISMTPLMTTGYGRNLFEGRTQAISELSALVRGGNWLFPGLRTIIDIGEQGCKVIAVENGAVVDFQTNDSCASGSGRFLDLIRQRLHIDSVLMEALLGQDQQIALHSTCAVFAESEIIRLLAHGVSKDAILGGVAASIAGRIAVLAEQVPVKAPAVLIGGLAESHGMCKILSRTLGVEIKPLQNGTYAGAIGAACFGFSDEQYEKIISHNATSASLRY